MRCLFVLLVSLLSIEAVAQRDSVDVYFIGCNKKGERYLVYGPDNKIILDFKTGVTFKYTFKVFRDTTLKSDMVAFRSIQIYKKRLFGYRMIGPSMVYLDKKYLVIRRDPKLRRKFSIDYFWTDDEPTSPYWHP